MLRVGGIDLSYKAANEFLKAPKAFLISLRSLRVIPLRLCVNPSRVPTKKTKLVRTWALGMEDHQSTLCTGKAPKAFFISLRSLRVIALRLCVNPSRVPTKKQNSFAPGVGYGGPSVYSLYWQGTKSLLHFFAFFACNCFASLREPFVNPS
jgi:hypothetical protein